MKLSKAEKVIRKLEKLENSFKENMEQEKKYNPYNSCIEYWNTAIDTINDIKHRIVERKLSIPNTKRLMLTRYVNLCKKDKGSTKECGEAFVMEIFLTEC